MNEKTSVFGLMIVVAAALGAVSNSAVVRVVALVIVAGASMLLGVALGAKPFKK